MLCSAGAGPQVLAGWCRVTGACSWRGLASAAVVGPVMKKQLSWPITMKTAPILLAATLLCGQLHTAPGKYLRCGKAASSSFATGEYEPPIAKCLLVQPELAGDSKYLQCT